MNQRVAFTSVAVLAAIFLLAFLTRFAESNQSKQTDDEKRLHALLVERRDTIKVQLAIAKAYEAGGRGGTEEVIRAQDRLFIAELALATKKPDRIKIHGDRVKNLARLEVYVNRMFETGIATRVATLQAKESRLSAEIDLYRTKTEK